MGKSPLAHLTELIPISNGKGAVRKYLLDVMDPFHYVRDEDPGGDRDPGRDQQEGWRFPLGTFHERLSAIYAAADKAPGTPSYRLIARMNHSVQHAWDAILGHPCRCAVCQGEDQDRMPDGFHLNYPNLPESRLRNVTLTEVRRGIAVEAFILTLDGMSSQAEIAQTLQTTAQNVNYHVWHILDSMADRFPLDLVVSALEEATAVPDTVLPGREGPTRQAAVLTLREAETIDGIVRTGRFFAALERKAARIFEDEYDREESVSWALEKVCRKISLISKAHDPTSYAILVGKSAIIDFQRREELHRERETPEAPSKLSDPGDRLERNPEGILLD